MMTAPAPLHPVTTAPLAHSVLELVRRCDAELVAAQLASDPAERFTHGHLAALRLAGAVLSAEPHRAARRGPASAWRRLATQEPALAAWATFFESGAGIRSAIDAGRTAAVDDALAARWVAAAEDFRDAVCVHLGIDPFGDLGHSVPGGHRRPGGRRAS